MKLLVGYSKSKPSKGKRKETQRIDEFANSASYNALMVNGRGFQPPLRFVTHGVEVTQIGRRYGWYHGARYDKLRNFRTRRRLGFLDIIWQDYDFHRHLRAARSLRPIMTVARDVTDMRSLNQVIEQAFQLQQYADYVIVVPKDVRLTSMLNEVIPKCFLLGFSVPTRYGGTEILPEAFRRPVHLLGGRPDTQRALAERMPVFSLDCNRFTLDAAFGDYFDGETFRPHPVGGFATCVRASFKNINNLWRGYMRPRLSRYVQPA